MYHVLLSMYTQRSLYKNINLQYFRPSLSYNLSLRSLFCLKTGFTVGCCYTWQMTVAALVSLLHSDFMTRTR